jgi:hypothetical protein
MSAYVILQPHSATNATGAFQVVWATDWNRYVNGSSDTLHHEDFPTYVDAEKHRDAMNDAMGVQY